MPKDFSYCEGNGILPVNNAADSWISILNNVKCLFLFGIIFSMVSKSSEHHKLLLLQCYTYKHSFFLYCYSEVWFSK